MAAKPHQWVRDRLERNYAEIMAGHYADRYEYIKQIPNLPGRMAELLMLDTLHRSSRHFVGQRLHLTLPEGMRYAGASSQYTDVVQDGVVTKIHRRSVRMSDVEQHALRQQHEVDHATLRRFLGAIIIPQTTYIGTHPLNSRHRAVLSQQQQVAVEPVRIFAGYKPEIDNDRLKELKAAHPGVEDALREFAQQSIKMYEEGGPLIDSSGQNTVGISEEGLVYLPGQPIPTPTDGDERRILGQLKALLRGTA